MDLSGCSIIITSTCFIGFLYIILFKSSCVMIILLCFASFDTVSNLTTITHLKVATRGYTTKVPPCHTSSTHRGCTTFMHKHPIYLTYIHKSNFGNCHTMCIEHILYHNIHSQHYMPPRVKRRN